MALPVYLSSSGLTYILSPVPVSAGMVVICIDGNNYLPYNPTNAGLYPGHAIGVALNKLSIPGNQLSVQHAGIVPQELFNLGPGNASYVTIGANGFPTRASLSPQTIGACDKSGVLIVYPSFVGQSFSGTGNQVSNTGLWHSTSGLLDQNALVGTEGQILFTNATPDTQFLYPSNDVSSSNTTPGKLTVVGVQSIPWQAGAPGNNNIPIYVSGTNTWTPGSVASILPNLAGDATGAPSANTVVGLTGTAGVVTAHGTSLAINWAAGNVTLQDNGTTVLSAGQNSGTDFLRLGTTPAASGIIRIGNGDYIAARNHAGTNDIEMISTGSNDLVIIGGLLSAGVLMTSNGQTFFQGSGVTATDNAALGTNPATSGTYRGPNNATLVMARNAANNADLPLIGTDSSNNIVAGGATPAGFLVKLPGQVAVQLQNATSDYIQFGGTGTAGSAYIRATNNATVIASRNAANNADLSLLGTDGSNNLVLGDAHVAGLVGKLPGQTAFQLQNASSDYIQFGGTGTATTGFIRATNNQPIVVSRNAANSGDLTVLQVDGSNNLNVANNSVHNVTVSCANIFSTFTNGGTSFSATNTAVTIFSPLSLTNQNTFTAATAGAATALPANPLGYLQINLGGTNVKIPYYSV